MGHLAKMHPEELVLHLLASGFTETCFDEEHPITGKDGKETLVSNMQDGAGPAWFLLDTSRAVKPLPRQMAAAHVHPLALLMMWSRQAFGCALTKLFCGSSDHEAQRTCRL